MNEIAIANRPTSQHIAELFKKYGITPIPYAYLLGRRYGPCCGCAIGALIVESLGSVEAALDQTFAGDERWFLGRLTDLPEKYLGGLDHGFSYASSSTEGQRLWNQFHDDPLYIEGFDIGRTVRALVLPDPPQESSDA
jgi:hypothetical protein